MVIFHIFPKCYCSTPDFQRFVRFLKKLQKTKSLAIRLRGHVPWCENAPLGKKQVEHGKVLGCVLCYRVQSPSFAVISFYLAFIRDDGLFVCVFFFFSGLLKQNQDMFISSKSKDKRYWCTDMEKTYPMMKLIPFLHISAGIFFVL